MRVYAIGLILLSLAAGCEEFLSYGQIRPDLFGYVTIDGRPVPGVVVVATNGSSAPRARTDANGRYSFNQIPFGWTTVTIDSAPEFVLFDPPSRRVELAGDEHDVSFAGYSPRTISGEVLWEYALGDRRAVPGVGVQVQQSPYPVPGVTTDADGQYRVIRAPGYGTYPVALGALPPGLAYRDANQWTFYSSALAELGKHTTIAVYRPAAGLRVDVFVDAISYFGATIEIGTPLPLVVAPGRFTNLPVQTVEVRLTGYPALVTFDTTSAVVELTTDSMRTVTFRGYSSDFNRFPLVSVVEPLDNATFPAGTPITFRALATDHEDGTLTGAALNWFSIGVASHGRGETITIDNLAVGPHRIAVEATDSGGKKVYANVDIEVVPATGGRVAGVVTVNGTPIAGKRVELSTTPLRFMLTNSQGAYAFENVPAGPRTVTVIPSECFEFPVNSAQINVVIGMTSTVNFQGNEVYCYDGSGGRGSVRIRPPR